MKRYIIERDIPKIGSLKNEQYREAAAKSNGVLQKLGPEIQWLESFVTADKMFCVYLAEDEGRAVGLLSLRLVPYLDQDVPYAEVMNLYVRPEARRGGVGTRPCLRRRTWRAPAGTRSARSPPARPPSSSGPKAHP